MYLCSPSAICVYENSGLLPIRYELWGWDKDKSFEGTNRDGETENNEEEKKDGDILEINKISLM